MHHGDSKPHAVACHDRAVELLKEGLPKVRVARVLQGQSVILAVGGQGRGR